MPSPRHRHTAVLHDNAMWVYGGMNDLQEKSDFWRFDFGMSSFLHEHNEYSFLYVSIQMDVIVLIQVMCVFHYFVFVTMYATTYICMYIHCYALQFPENGDWCGLNQDQAVYIPSVL